MMRGVKLLVKLKIMAALTENKNELAVLFNFQYWGDDACGDGGSSLFNWYDFNEMCYNTQRQLDITPPSNPTTSKLQFIKMYISDFIGMYACLYPSYS